MNRNFLIIGVMGVLCFSQCNAPADLEVSKEVRVQGIEDFKAPLSGLGRWTDYPKFGPCWRPTHVAADWRPYCDGQWVWTDNGWYWKSDEPWSWACYHYGYWVHDVVYGWGWLPDVEWAPAWVTWRFGGGYCGWAPMAPMGVDAEPWLFVFVESRHFDRPVGPSEVMTNDTTVIGQTALLEGPKREQRMISGDEAQTFMVNNGPGIDPIEEATGGKIRQVQIQEAVRQASVPREVKRAIREPAGAGVP